MYVFDCNSFVVLFHYYPDRFPSLWRKFDELLDQREVVSVREVYNEIMEKGEADLLVKWTKEHRSVFEQPSVEELAFVGEIFRVRHFQQLVEKRKMLGGRPVADPFIVAKAKMAGGTVVTMEKHRENAAKIPNVCEHFGVRWMNVEAFMVEQGWQF